MQQQRGLFAVCVANQDTTAVRVRLILVGEEVVGALGVEINFFLLFFMYKFTTRDKTHTNASIRPPLDAIMRPRGFIANRSCRWRVDLRTVKLLLSLVSLFFSFLPFWFLLRVSPFPKCRCESAKARFSFQVLGNVPTSGR